MLPTRAHYVVLFLVSLCILMLELSVARILSVALLSHYAFVAISLAMFGLGLSGLVVYLFPNHFGAATVDQRVAVYCRRFALSAALSDLAFLRIHVIQELSLPGFASLSLAYVVLAVPFFFGGVCVSLLMTHFARRIGSLYAADLVGASVGCLGAVAALTVAPAPLVPLLVALVAAATSLLLASRNAATPVRGYVLATLVVASLLLAGLTTDVARIRYVKDWAGFYSDYEAWNAFSRVSVLRGDLSAANTLALRKRPQDPAADTYPTARWLDIDGTAWTPMLRFDGDLSGMQFLGGSVIYAAHRVRPNAKVLIIGTGGGRDILAAATLRQPSVLGIEINPLVEHVVQTRFASFSGRPYTLPGVQVLIGEGRSTLTQINDTFDVIQLSLVDTFAAGAAGGFVFTENYLYTQEAVQEYFRHLRPGGLLSITRYYTDDYPLEMMRLLRMTTAAWQAESVADPGSQIVILNQKLVATMLAKRGPYTDEELGVLDEIARENDMVFVYDPRRHTPGQDEVVTMVGAGSRFLDARSFDTAPSTDDRPYFFHFLRRRVPIVGTGPFSPIRNWVDALVLMSLLIVTVSTLALLFFLGPLLLFGRRRVRRRAVAAPMLLYFLCLGYGFMMIEVPVLQRLVLLLGYPVYALAVGLFSLLLFSGLGSLASERIATHPRRALMTVVSAIIAAALAYGIALPAVIRPFLGAPAVGRIAVAVLMLAPLGLLLGMAYPLGIRILQEHDEGLVPWAWGLNGAASVVASVLAVFVSSRVGFTVALLSGAAAYAVGLVAIGTACRLLSPRVAPAALRRAAAG